MLENRGNSGHRVEIPFTGAAVAPTVAVTDDEEGADEVEKEGEVEEKPAVE